MKKPALISVIIGAVSLAAAIIAIIIACRHKAQKCDCNTFD